MNFRMANCFDLRNFSNDNWLCAIIHPEFSSDNLLPLKSRCDLEKSLRFFKLFTPSENLIYCLSIGQEHFWNTVPWLKYLMTFPIIGHERSHKICWNSITTQRNVTCSYETHPIISQGTLNCWLDPKHQNTTVLINALVVSHYVIHLPKCHFQSM